MKAKMSWKALKGGVLALSALAVGLTAPAETVLQGVWSRTNGNCRWTADETGAWTFGSWENGFANETWSGWIHDGVLHTPRVTDKTAGTATVFRSGSAGALPVLTVAGMTEAAAVAVTPNGRWCYLLTNAGFYRYDLSSGSAGEWSLVDAQTTKCPRSIAFDDAGHVFISIRDNGSSYYGGLEDIRCYDSETGASVWKVRFNTTDANGPTGLCWNPADNYLYWTRTDRHLFRMPADGGLSKLESYTFSSKEGGDQMGGWAAGLCVLNGTFYMNYCNTSEGRITTFNWPLTNAAPSNFSGEENKISSFAGSWANGLSIARSVPAAAWRFVDSEPTLVGRGSFRKGAVTPATFGVKSGAGYFAGPNAYAFLSGSAALVPATADFTLTFWTYVQPLAETPASPRCLCSNAAGQNGALSVVADQGEANTLGLVFTKGDGTSVSVAGGPVADGAWHQVSVCRRGGTALELWLDGVRQGALAIAAADAVAQDTDWHFGCMGDESAGYVGAGAALGEIRLFSKAVPREELADLGKSLVYAEAPSDPGAPTSYDPMPARFGTEIAHTFAEETPFGDPGVFVAANGDYFAYVCKLGPAAMVGQATAIYRSTDGGSTWSAWSSLAASGVTLFESGDVLCAFGQRDARTFAVWKYVDSAWTEAASAAAADGVFRMSSGLVSVGGGKVMKPVVRNFAPYSNAGRLAFVSFAVDGASFSGGGVYVKEGTNLEWADPTVRGMKPGHAIWLDGSAHAMNAIERDARGTIPVCADENFYYAVRYDYEPEKNPYGILGNYYDFGIFRGGNATYGLALDAVSGLVRSVSIAGGKFVLQASKTCRDWMPCGEFDLPDDGTVYAPSIAIDGNDLVMVTGVRCDDGAGGAELTDGGVYLAFRKVVGFRTAYVPEEPTKTSRSMVYSVNERGSCEKVWQATDGRWYQGSIFKKMWTSLGSDTLTSPMGVCYAQKHYFIHQGNAAKLYVLDTDGNWQKTIALPASCWWAEVCADKNGRHLTVRIDGDSIASVDWRSGTVTKIIDKNNANWHAYDKFAVASDGTIYACGFKTTTSPYGNYLIDRISPDGTVTTLHSIYCADAGWTSFGGVALDEAEANVYFITAKGKLQKYEISTGVISQIADFKFTSGSTCMMLRYCDGKLYFSGNSGKTMRIDLATGALEPVLGYAYQVRGMAIYDYKPTGLTVIFR